VRGFVLIRFLCLRWVSSNATDERLLRFTRNDVPAASLFFNPILLLGEKRESNYNS
jgi:hypothetical protein